jgi:hypothetical protein
MPVTRPPRPETQQEQASNPNLPPATEKAEKGDELPWTTVVAGVSFITLILSAIGTSSAIILGWRTDRRQTQEFKLKIQQLEMQLAEARATAVKKNLDIAI